MWKPLNVADFLSGGGSHVQVFRCATRFGASQRISHARPNTSAVTLSISRSVSQRTAGPWPFVRPLSKLSSNIWGSQSCNDPESAPLTVLALGGVTAADALHLGCLLFIFTVWILYLFWFSGTNVCIIIQMKEQLTCCTHYAVINV